MGAGNGYTIYVKGEKHVANKFCRMIGQVGHCSGTGNIPVPETTAIPMSLYDFTGYPLEPGDLPPQDGKADAADFAKITSLMAKSFKSLAVLLAAAGIFVAGLLTLPIGLGILAASVSNAAKLGGFAGRTVDSTARVFTEPAITLTFR